MNLGEHDMHDVNHVSSPSSLPQGPAVGKFKHLLGNTFKRSPCSTKHMLAVNDASKPSSVSCGSNSVSQKVNGGDEVTLGAHDMHNINHASSPSSMPQEFNCASQEFGGDELTLGERATQSGQYNKSPSMRGELSSDSLLALQHQTNPCQLGSYPLHQVSSSLLFCKWCLITICSRSGDKYELEHI